MDNSPHTLGHGALRVPYPFSYYSCRVLYSPLCEIDPRALQDHGNSQRIRLRRRSLEGQQRGRRINAPLRVGVDDKVHANVCFGLRVDERDSLLLSSGGWFGLGVVVLSAVAGVGLHALEVFLLA